MKRQLYNDQGVLIFARKKNWRKSKFMKGFGTFEPRNRFNKRQANRRTRRMAS